MQKPNSAAPNKAAVYDAKANNELLFKGGLCAAIGLGVLLSPAFMGGSGLREVVAQASTVGWFALVLGGALLAKGIVRRWKALSALS